MVFELSCCPALLGRLQQRARRLLLWMLRFIGTFCFCFALTDDDVTSTTERVLLALTHPGSDLRRHIDIMSHSRCSNVQLQTAPNTSHYVTIFFMAGQALLTLSSSDFLSIEKFEQVLNKFLTCAEWIESYDGYWLLTLPATVTFFLPYNYLSSGF